MTPFDQLSETEKADVVMSVQMETRRAGHQQAAWYNKKKNEAAQRILDWKQTPTNHAATNHFVIHGGMVNTGTNTFGTTNNTTTVTPSKTLARVSKEEEHEHEPEMVEEELSRKRRVQFTPNTQEKPWKTKHDPSSGKKRRRIGSAKKVLDVVSPEALARGIRVLGTDNNRLRRALGPTFDLSTPALDRYYRRNTLFTSVCRPFHRIVQASIAST